MVLKVILILPSVYDAAGNKLKKTVQTIGRVVHKLLPITSAASFTKTTIYNFLSMRKGGRGSKTVTTCTTTLSKDHLGNVRVVLTDEEHQDEYPPATLETAPLPNEEAYYTNLPNTRVLKPAGYPLDPFSSPNDWVAKLNGGGERIGPGIMLKVMAGDRFNVRVSSWLYLS